MPLDRGKERHLIGALHSPAPPIMLVMSNIANMREQGMQEYGIRVANRGSAGNEQFFKVGGIGEGGNGFANGESGRWPLTEAAQHAITMTTDCNPIAVRIGNGEHDFTLRRDVDNSWTREYRDGRVNVQIDDRPNWWHYRDAADINDRRAAFDLALQAIALGEITSVQVIFQDDDFTWHRNWEESYQHGPNGRVDVKIGEQWWQYKAGHELADGNEAEELAMAAKQLDQVEAVMFGGASYAAGMPGAGFSWDRDDDDNDGW